MIEFRVNLSNQPGQLAKMCQELGMRGINLHAMASVSQGGPDDPAVFALITDNAQQTREALQKLNLSFKEFEALQVRILDHAGELGRFAQRLGEAGINIDSIYICDKISNEVEVAFTVNDPAKAKALLKL